VARGRDFNWNFGCPILDLFFQERGFLSLISRFNARNQCESLRTFLRNHVA
jgi:hypothetical protein